MNSVKTQKIDLVQDMSELLCELDTRISKTSKKKLDAVRYGLKCQGDFIELISLSRYRRILVEKLNGNRCFCDYLLDDIISNIRQYLYHGKIQKFNKKDK